MATRQVSESRLPLRGVRVVACSQFVASPYAATLLAELGADVIKVESHHRVDPGRTNIANPGSLGAFPDNVTGADWWNRSSFFHELNRKQSSVTLDLRSDRGHELFVELVKRSDVLIESYTPRVMRGWSLDYPELRKHKPDLIMLSLTAFGHGPGPYASYTGTATSLEATHGHCSITGYRDGPPSKAGMAFVDFVGAWSIVLAISGALWHRSRTGHGQWIDMSLYQLGCLLLSEFLLDYGVNGRIPSRIGDRHPTRLQNAYPAAGEDEWVVISIGDDDQWSRLCELMLREDLLRDTRYRSIVDRRAQQDELDAEIASWTRTRAKYDIFHVLQTNGIPAAPVLDAKDLHTDPHHRARGFVEPVVFPRETGIGVRPLIANPWKFDGETPVSGVSGPRLGEHNHEILEGLLGLTSDDVRDLERAGVLGTELVGHAPPRTISLDDFVRLGLLSSYDPSYKSVLARFEAKNGGEDHGDK